MIELEKPSTERPKTRQQLTSSAGRPPTTAAGRPPTAATGTPEIRPTTAKQNRPLTAIQNERENTQSPVAMSPTPLNIEIIFVDELPEELQCPVCKQALRSPMKLSCGDFMCASCLVQHRNDACPKCNTPMDKTKAKKDREIQKRIQSLEVKCSYFDNGCTWTGALKDLQSHSYGCKYADTVCPRGCGQVFPRDQEAHHLLEECGKRIKNCEYCQKEISAKGMEVHLKICPAFIMDCPFHCGLEGATRETVKLHLPTCPNAGSSCPFAQFGCSYAGDKDTIRNHLSEEPIRHLSYLCDGVLDLKILLTSLQLNMEGLLSNIEMLRKKCLTLEKLYGSQMIWRIDNVKQKQNEARSGTRTTIFSNPFMSGRHGYKMVLSASLYGDGTMRGQYLSVFVGIMKGEYDALLEWPFTHRVTLTLMDQNPNIESRNNIVYVIEPTPIAAHKPFLDRPISERNASFGAVKFCELDVAEKYIVDDVMFIKCDIDTSNMIPM